MNNTTANATNGTFTSDPFPPAPSKSFWLGLLWPTLYLTILIGSLYTFSTTYRRRQQAKKARLAPLLPPHRQRDIYLSLLHLEPSSAGGEEKEKTLKKVPDSILKAALLQRALEDIKRIVQLRSAKPALQTLLQRGSVGDELWQRFLSAEQEMEAEVKDVVNEVRRSLSHSLSRPLAPALCGPGLSLCLAGANRERLCLTGQCFCARVGPSDFPVGERDEPEPAGARADC